MRRNSYRKLHKKTHHGDTKHSNWGLKTAVAAYGMRGVCAMYVWWGFFVVRGLRQPSGAVAVVFSRGISTKTAVGLEIFEEVSWCFEAPPERLAGKGGTSTPHGAGLQQHKVTCCIHQNLKHITCGETLCLVHRSQRTDHHRAVGVARNDDYKHTMAHTYTLVVLGSKTNLPRGGGRPCVWGGGARVPCNACRGVPWGCIW